MNVSVQDIHQTLEYRSTAAIARLLPTGLLLIFLALVLLALSAYDRDVWTLIGIVLCLWVAKGRAEQKDWADSIRRNREESRKLEAEQKELRRQLDEDMRRMFSR